MTVLQDRSTRMISLMPIPQQDHLTKKEGFSFNYLAVK